jgi:hypothetical protein
MMNVFSVDCKTLQGIQTQIVLLLLVFDMFVARHTPPLLFQRKIP